MKHAVREPVNGINVDSAINIPWPLKLCKCMRKMDLLAIYEDEMLKCLVERRDGRMGGMKYAGMDCVNRCQWRLLTRISHLLIM